MSHETVNRALFKPYKGKVSVFQTEGWSEQKKKKQGVEVARERDKKLYGWATIRTVEVPKCIQFGTDEHISQCSLTVEVDNNPPGHANIIGWPNELDEALGWQAELARKSTPKKFDSPIPVETPPPSS